MKPTIRFVVITALRDRLFASLIGLLVIAFGVSAYLGSGAVMESREMMAVYAAGSARALVVLGLIVFTAFHVERLFDTREIEAVLSRAISREKFIFAYWAGLAFIGALFILPVAIATFFLGMSREGAVYWSLSVFFEMLIVTAFTLFAALTLERAIPTIFASAGFYGLARLIGFFVGIASNTDGGAINDAINPIIEMLFYMIPRLDLTGQTRWLVYGLEDKSIILLVALQVVIYVPLLLSAAMFDLRRKHF